MPASHLEEVYRFFQNKPIELKDFDQFYVDADKGRGVPTYKLLKMRLEKEPDGRFKVLFAGHKGCGKTTELIRLQKNIQQDFVVMNFSVMNELDILNINYIELFIVTMEKLVDFFKDHEEIRIDPRHLENIRNWLQSEDIEKVNEKHLGLDMAAETQAGIDIPFIAKFFAKLRAAAKTSASVKQTLKTHVEPRLSDMILNCNLLINEIKKQLPDIGKKGLVIIIEDLDKVDLQKAEDIFYLHSNQLTQLNCHCIFTFPVALVYHIRFKTIINNYDEKRELPMIRVSEKNGDDCTDGLDIMKRIVSQRMDLALFDEETILTGMIKKSGGCLWDLFRMIKDAADYAVIYERKKITQTDYLWAYRQLKSDYERTIAENPEKNIKVDDYYDALRACALDKNKKLKETEAALDLMNNLTILGYNGEMWHDVHPIVKDILKERELI